MFQIKVVTHIIIYNKDIFTDCGHLVSQKLLI